ncbi:MAG: metallophosphoesterase family protein [Bacillota bacterium]
MGKRVCRELMVGVFGIGWILAGVSFGDGTGVTFFGWSDQHVTVRGDASHLVPAVEAMNGMEGTAFPADIGGKVGRPAFVFGCGDITEWPTAAARNAYEQVATKGLKIRSYDMVGNHDEGGKSPSMTIKNWIVMRHGQLSYTFEEGGVRFLAVYSAYDESLDNPAQAIAPEALEYIRRELKQVPKDQPVVIALHLCLDAITNRDELVKALGDANVVMVLGGHYHKATVGEYGGYRFVQLPSPSTTTEFTVIRISGDRLVAIPYDFKNKRWSEDPRVRLDVAIRGPQRVGK